MGHPRASVGPPHMPKPHLVIATAHSKASTSSVVLSRSAVPIHPPDASLNCVCGSGAVLRSLGVAPRPCCLSSFHPCSPFARANGTAIASRPDVCTAAMRGCSRVKPPRSSQETCLRCRPCLACTRARTHVSEGRCLYS
ncbi:unnamed protein product [Ectocarpus fasciculatus]